MIIRISHPDISGNEKTYLTVAAVSGDTTLTVHGVKGFAVGNYLVLGKIGDKNEKTELVRIHTSTAPAVATITLNAAILYDHSVNTPVTYIAFNQIAVYSSTTKTGTYTELTAQASGDSSPVAIEVDQDFTEFNHAAGSTSTWYKVKYYNGSTYSSYSDPVQGTGYTEDSLRKILDKSNALSNDRDNKVFTEEEKIDIVNDGYQQTINKLEKADSKRFLKKGYVDIKNSYETGTVAVVDGATAVAGSGTTWVDTWTGKKIVFEDEGFPYEISSVTDATNLVLTRAYNGAGSDLSGATYIIFQDEYDVYDESTGVEVIDFKKVEQVTDENGNIVNEYDLHRKENGFYLKREEENMKFCLNYILSTSDDEGRWTVWYSYQPVKLDSMADEPEFPAGYSGILSSYLTAKIWERKGEQSKAVYYMGEFISLQDKLIGQATPRTKEKKEFRIDRNLRGGKEHDEDWGYENLWGRKTIGT